MRKLKGFIVGCILVWLVLTGIMLVLWDEFKTLIDGKYRGPVPNEDRPEENHEKESE